jgi:RNA polymerase sigma-70 factor (ECF subfamily)
MSQHAGVRQLWVMITGVEARDACAAAAVSAEDLFVRNERRIGAFLVQLVGDRGLAEDLLQDTFLEVHRHPDRIIGASNPDAWVFGVARKRALAALRRSRRLRAATARLAAGKRPALDFDPPQAEIFDVLTRVLAPPDRALVVLRYVHGFDAIALAEMTGRSPAAVRKRLERACTRLAEVIER